MGRLFFRIIAVDPQNGRMEPSTTNGIDETASRGPEATSDTVAIANVAASPRTPQPQPIERAVREAEAAQAEPTPYRTRVGSTTTTPYARKRNSGTLPGHASIIACMVNLLWFHADPHDNPAMVLTNWVDLFHCEPLLQALMMPGGIPISTTWTWPRQARAVSAAKPVLEAMNVTV
jgi:hypothetical protein